MSTGFSFEIKSSQEGSMARVGTITTPHGAIQTPAFIPVGTKATVKSVLPEAMADLGAKPQIFTVSHNSRQGCGKGRLVSNKERK